MRSSSTCLTMIGAEILAEAAQKAEGRRGCEELTARRSGLNAPVCAQLRSALVSPVADGDPHGPGPASGHITATSSLRPFFGPPPGLEDQW